MPWTVACQAPLSMGFSRQGHWNRLVTNSFSRGPPDPRIEPTTPALAGRFFTIELHGKPLGSESESRWVCPTLCDPTDSPWDSPGQNTGVGSLSLLQGIFPTQGSNPGLPHCRWILNQLSQKGSPRMLRWVAYPFSGDFLTQEWTRGLLHCRPILYQLSYQKALTSWV